MNLEPAPRLPKWIFLAIDAGLLLVAFVIVYFAQDPYAPLPFVSAVVCAVLAAIIGLVPFLADYAADTAEAVERERERLNEQATRLHAATESLARAAAHIKSVEEAVHKSARDAETLPYRMQEKLAEFNESLAAKEESDREALETELEELRAAQSDQLKVVAEKISKAAAELAALDASARRQLAASESALAKIQSGTAEAAAKLEAQISQALREIDARVAALQTAVAAAPTRPAAPAAPATTRSEPISSEVTNGAHAPAPAPVAVEPAPGASGSDAPADLSAMIADVPRPKKPRALRKPKPEETLAAMSAPEGAATAAPSDSAAASEVALEAAPAAVAVATEEPTGESTVAPESSASSDGATRLLATAYIGIGNKLFIRGDGPGLSWDRGVPMQFVSIGKWGWSSPEGVGPVRCKLYKNDETPSLSGDIVLEAGRHTEVTALF